MENHDKKNSNKKDRLFNLKITDTLRKLIKKDAYDLDVSASEVVRRILEDHYGVRKDEEQKS